MGKLRGFVRAIGLQKRKAPVRTIVVIGMALEVD